MNRREERERTRIESLFPEAPQARKDSKHEKKMYKTNIGEFDERAFSSPQRVSRVA